MSDAELYHYGVKGMKWGRSSGGVQPQGSRRQRRIAKGNAKIERAGSAKAAAWGIAGRRVGVAVLTTYGPRLVLAATKSPTAYLGARAALNVTNNVMFVKDVVDAVQVRAAVNDRRERQG